MASQDQDSGHMPGAEGITETNTQPKSSDNNPAVRQFNKHTSDIKRYWFCATTSIGNIKLGIAKAESDVPLIGDAALLAAACALGQHESIVRWIEDWLGCALDLQRTQAPLDIKNVSLTISHQSENSLTPYADVLLSIPATILMTIKPPIVNDELPVNIHWQRIKCTLTAAHFAIAADQLHQLAVGGLVIIPNSFQSPWLCQVQPIQAGMEKDTALSAELNADNASLFFSRLTQDAEPSWNTPSLPLQQQDDDLLVNLVLESACAIPVDCLLGWNKIEAEPTQFCLAASALSATTLSTFRWQLKHAGNVLALGKLLPVASGFGLLVDTIEQSAQLSSTTEE